jgi:flagellar biosynthetic protein FliO
MLETAPPSEVGSLGAGLAASLLSLGFVCVLAYLALRWLSRRQIGPSHGPLRILARQSLDPKRSLFVIEAAERCFLVGAGDGAMTLLAELDREVLAREMAPRRSASRPSPAMAFLGAKAASFAEVLTRTLSKPASAPTPPPPPESPPPPTAERAPDGSAA